jgi:hypothetical protein
MAGYRSKEAGRGSAPGSIVGLLMVAGGIYLLLQNIVVGSFGLFGYPLYSAWGVELTSGYALIPLMFGIGLLFYGRRTLGWTVTGCSAAAIFFGVLAEMRITFRTMSLFDLLVILTLIAGGLGLLLRAYAASRKEAAGEVEFQHRVDAELRARLAAANPARADVLGHRLKALDEGKP